MLKIYHCNLHLHTCLSPCGDLDMHPRALVAECLACDLDIIAVCDHNSSENVPYVQRAALGTKLLVLPGMEVTSREEVHVTALFEDLETLAKLQDEVYRHLHGKNNEDVLGMQVIVNENGEVEGYNERLLIGATAIPIKELVDRIHYLGGMAVAAHIDRQSFSVLSQLGFIPPDLLFDALEVSARLGIKKAREKFPELSKYTLISNSDAHFLSDIGKTMTCIRMAEPSFKELRLAFSRREGRGVEES